MTTVVGKLYKWIVYINKGDAAVGEINIGTSDNNNSYFGSGNLTHGSWTAYSGIIEATTTTTFITVTAEAGTATMFYDTISLYEVTPGCVATDVLACDGWYKDGAANNEIWRMHSDGATEAVTKLGSFYALKMNFHASGYELTHGGLRNSELENISRFAGRTVTVGAWIKSSAATLLRMTDSAGTSEIAHSDVNQWQWLEVTRTFAGNITNCTPFKLRGVGTETAYISQPMMVFGSSIGEGNYTRPQGEIVWFENELDFNDYNGNDAVSSNTGVLNVEVQSDGKIPKGAKALYCTILGTGDAVDTSLFVYDGSDTELKGVWGITQVASRYFAANGWQQCDLNGDVGIGRDGSFSNVRLRVTGVQLR
jgi:hypothetical protein